MGRQDQKYPETNNTNVFSDRGLFRYKKELNAKGNRKFSKRRIETKNRSKGNEFSAAPAGGKHRAD